MNGDNKNVTEENKSEIDENPRRADSPLRKENTSAAKGDYIVQRNKRIDLIAKIVCFIGAFILWFYVMQVESPEYQQVFSLVPVTFEGASKIGTEYGLSVYSGMEKPVEVTVKGKKSDISKIKLEDIVATVDLSSISKSGDYKLNVNVELPSNLTVEAVYPNVISVYVDEKTSATLEIIASLGNISIESPNYMADPVIDDPEVTVTGPKRIIDELSHAEVKCNVGKISATTNLTQSLVIIKKDGDEQKITSNIKLSKTEVSVKIPVYTYKTVPLYFSFKYGYFNDSNAEIKISPETVKIKGDPNDLALCEKLPVTVIDEKKIVSDETQYINLVLPDNIQIADGTSVVTVDIKLKNTVTREIKYSKNRIKVTNAENIAYEIIDDLITITFRGSESEIEDVKSSDVSVTLDLSSYTDISGIVTAPVSVTLSDNTGKSVYEIGDYKVQVEIFG